MEFVKDILDKIDIIEASKFYKTKEDYSRFYKWCKRYNNRLSRKKIARKYEQITGIKIY